jgi:hypothetical protein
MDTETPDILRIFATCGQWVAMDLCPACYIKNKGAILDIWQNGIAWIAVLPTVRRRAVSVQREV